MPTTETYINQQYELYTAENHRTWQRLYERMQPRWRQYANQHFLKGVDSLCFNPERIPRLEEVNGFLCPLTGFQAVAVSGYMPAFEFFDCLRSRKFPTTVTIRRGDQLDYLPEPDIFHDIAGHVPMHTDRAFANALVRFGDCAHTAAEIAAGSDALPSIVKAMARFFWFTVEFGLMRENGKLKAYGSGLLSSYGELEHAVESRKVERLPMDLGRAINQPFEIDHYQPRLFVVDGFDHLFSLVDELERWMKAGRLDSVAGGEPSINKADLASFALQHA